MSAEWGPLAGLAGEWEGNDGLDIAFHNAKGEIGETGYLEKITLKPFGPVDNGKQCLFGLDYRMAAWRHGEENDNPFHTEVGYWLWDAADNEVFRCFMVPRATVLIAGANTSPDAKSFTLEAKPGDACYGILENKYLANNASTRLYTCSIEIHDDDSWSYSSNTRVRLTATGGEMDHTDKNTLKRTAAGF